MLTAHNGQLTLNRRKKIITILSLGLSSFHKSRTFADKDKEESKMTKDK